MRSKQQEDATGERTPLISAPSVLPPPARRPPTTGSRGGDGGGSHLGRSAADVIDSAVVSLGAPGGPGRSRRRRPPNALEDGLVDPDDWRVGCGGRPGGSGGAADVLAGCRVSDAFLRGPGAAGYWDDV